MGEDRIDIHPAVPPTHCISDFHVAISSTAGRGARQHDIPARHALDRDFGARAAILRRVNRHGVRQTAHRCRSGRILLPHTRLALFMPHRVDAMIKE